MTRIINTDFAVVEQRMMAEFTGLLPLCAPPRNLEDALAEYMAASRTQAEMTTANRLFAHLTTPAQMRVRALLRRRAA